MTGLNLSFQKHSIYKKYDKHSTYIKSIHHMKSIKSQKIIRAIITGDVFFTLILLVEIFTFPKQKKKKWF